MNEDRLKDIYDKFATEDDPHSPWFSGKQEVPEESEDENESE